jgi:AsmA protein
MVNRLAESAREKPPRTRVLKYVLGGLVALATLGAGMLVYLAITFDARDYAPHIVRYVQEQTGRTLRLEGDMKLSLWPRVGIDLDRAWLSERATDDHFIDVERAHVTAELLPLISRRLVAREVRLRGARIAIVRLADGRLNIEDLLQREGDALQFDIARFVMESSTVSYRDVTRAKRYELFGLNVETGRLANRAQTPIKAEFGARDAPQSFEMTALIDGELVLDTAKQSYGLGRTAFELQGRAPGVERFAAKALGNFAADLSSQRFEATRLHVSGNGSVRGEAIELDARTQHLTASAGRAQATALELNMRATGAAGKTHVKIAIPELQREADVVRTAAAALDVALDRGGVQITATAATPMEAHLGARSLTLAELQASIHAVGSRLPRGGIKGNLAGHSKIDLAREGVQLELAGKIDGSRAAARASSTGFASPVYTFALDIDELDADRYAGTTSKSGTSARATQNLAVLENLPATGTVHIGVLRAGGAVAKNVKLALR